MFSFTVYSSKIDTGFRVVAGEHAPMQNPEQWRVSVYQGLTPGAAAQAAYEFEKVERIREQILRFIPDPQIEIPSIVARSKVSVAEAVKRMKGKKVMAGMRRTTVKAGSGRPKVSHVDVPSKYPNYNILQKTQVFNGLCAVCGSFGGYPKACESCAPKFTKKVTQ